MVESFGPDVKGSEMGLIFWIDENTFASSLIGKTFKSQGVDFYTIDGVNDFAYLISDLKPQIMVIDASTAQKGLEDLKRQYQETAQFYGAKIVVIGDKTVLSFMEIGSELLRPIDPFSLKEFFAKI